MTQGTGAQGRLAALLIGAMALGLSACATLDDITPHRAAQATPEGTVTPERLSALAAERESGMYGFTTASVSGGGAGAAAALAPGEAAPADTPAARGAARASRRTAEPRRRVTSGNTGPSPALPEERRRIDGEPLRSPPIPERTPRSLTPPPLRPQTEFTPLPPGRPSLAELARRTPSVHSGAEGTGAEARLPRTATTADGETVVIGPGSRRVMGYLGPSGPGTIHRDGATGTAFGADGTIRPVQFPR